MWNPIESFIKSLAPDVEESEAVALRSLGTSKREQLHSEADAESRAVISNPLGQPIKQSAIDQGINARCESAIPRKNQA